MNKKELLLKLEKFAKRHRLGFGALKDKLIEAILKNNGYCPCRRVKSEDTLCPCRYALEEVEKNGKCLCGLFVKLR
ncbi:MAG: ferredoxin-thioredoxin reductase catalytic domain-containing protein [Candidatus Thermoplasmatota archaeon]